MNTWAGAANWALRPLKEDLTWELPTNDSPCQDTSRHSKCPQQHKHRLRGFLIDDISTRVLQGLYMGFVRVLSGIFKGLRVLQYTTIQGTHEAGSSERRYAAKNVQIAAQASTLLLLKRQQWCVSHHSRSKRCPLPQTLLALSRRRAAKFMHLTNPTAETDDRA